MAFNYKMIDGNGEFKILETKTEQIIRTYTDNSEARKFLRHLNLGGGFDGWTPTFFLKVFKIKTDSD